MTLAQVFSSEFANLLIPNPDLDFWISDPKIHFWAKLDPKTQSCSFCLKIGAHSISRMLISNPGLDFWNFYPKIHFWAKASVLTENWHSWYLRSADSESGLSFWNSEAKIHFWENLGQKSQSCLFFLKNWVTWHLDDADFFSNISFLNLRQ